jgi:signal transduction histidine kinase
LVKTLLLISSERTAGALGDLHTIAGLRVIPRNSVADAASAVAAGVFDLALVVTEAWSDATAAELQRLRQGAPRLRVLLATDSGSLTSAYAAGADAAVPWPESSTIIRQIVGRWIEGGVGADRVLPPAGGRGASLFPWPAAPNHSQSALEILREFSKILSHSLDERSFAQRLVEQLGEILGVVRIALFLEPDTEIQAVVAVADPDPRLICAAAVGIPSDITSCVELSRHGGLGRMMTHRRGVFSKYSPHLQADLQGDLRILQEFDVLGCDMALPIRDRDKVIGVAVLGERITGEPFTTEELNLGYFLMGELGMAIRNSRLHRSLTVHHELLSRVLESITSGSLVVGTDLRVLHANRTAATLLGLADGRIPSASDLPPVVLQSLHAVVTQGAKSEPLFHERPDRGSRLLRYSIIPLHGDEGHATRPVIVLIEDWTQIQAAKKAEIDSANTELITTIAARFAHEIRNSLVPLSTHSQLFQSQAGNASFLESLRTSLHRETLRIRRLSDQMLFLARPDSRGEDLISVGQILTDAFATAQDIVSKPGEMICTGSSDLQLKCTRESLTYALQEILANSLQSVAGHSTIRVKLMPTSQGGKPAVAIEVSDSGSGFTPETAARATEPFYTTRTTGVGLGLAVARKIVQEHGGELLIHHRTRSDQPDVQLILPVP